MYIVKPFKMTSKDGVDGNFSIEEVKGKWIIRFGDKVETYAQPSASLSEHVKADIMALCVQDFEKKYKLV